jgi:hypothetical protein
MRRVLLTVTLALVLLSPAAAAPPAAQAAKALWLARDIADVAELLDRLTAVVKGRPVARVDRAPAFEGLELSARFRVPGVEVRDHISNEVFGREVPGRRVDIVIKVDCVVRCTIDPGAIEVEADPDYPTRWS